MEGIGRRRNEEGRRTTGGLLRFVVSSIELLNQRSKEIPIERAARRVSAYGLAYLRRAGRAVHIALRLMWRQACCVKG
jgi:hypothetical protein